MKTSASKIFLRLFKDSKVIAGWLVLASFITLASIVFALLSPEILSELTDIIYYFWDDGISIDWQRFMFLCASLAIVYALGSFSEVLSMALMNNVVTKFYTAGFRIRISDKIRRLPIKFIDSTPDGEIIARMNNDVSTVGGSVHNIFSILIDGVIRLIGITVIVFVLNPVMAAIIVVFVPVSLAFSAFLAGRSEKHFDEYRKSMGKIYSFVEEDYGGFDTVKAFNLESRQSALHNSLCDEAAKTGANGYYINGLVQPVITFSNNIVFIAICIIGGYFAINGTFSVGTVLAFVLYAKQFSSPLSNIANGLSMMQNTIVAARRVYQLLDEEEMTEEQEEAVSDCKGEVVFEHVNFAYDKEKPLIKDLCLKVNPGQKVAIVGPTGGGKTTIVNLLMRFYDADGGKIYIDGKDIYSMSRTELRSEFAMVLQDTWLFGGTVYDNIAYGKPDASREEVMEAARLAHIDNFIDTLPDGYDTVINEEGGNISGGQKQLLTIARAYLSNRKMLILDEATSNVDTRVELLIQNSMDILMKGRTSFVIAHRLSTIVDADIILVVKDGQIVEQGTHASLMALNGFYSEIYNSQYELLK